MDRNSLRLLIGQGLSLEEIGRRVGRDKSTVGYWVKKHGLQAANANVNAPRGALSVERLAPLAEQGLTVQAIADAVSRSHATVRYWLRHHDLEGRREQCRRALRETRPSKARLRCDQHGDATFQPDAQSNYRCLKCRAEAVARRRRKVKRLLVEEFGGGCSRCGYDRCTAALHFHHLDPKTKEFGVSVGGFTRSIETLRGEARKCVLLCSNCHAEVEWGDICPTIPQLVSAE